MSGENLKGQLNGKDYWRSLNQLSDTPEFRDFVHQEFPAGASEMRDQVSRRTFLSLMGASLAFAGLAGCRKPVEKILPYVTAPENVIPGVPQHYATTMPLGLEAYGILVENHEGRPTKIEGNELHPATLGATDAWIQASLLGLYDPDRSQRILEKGNEKNWADFVQFWRSQLEKLTLNQGSGLAIVSESFSSPTLARLMAAFKTKYPQAIWATYEPVSTENEIEGMRLIAGRPLRVDRAFDKAQVVLALDSDFLKSEPGSVRAARGFAAARRIVSERDEMNRLYAVEGVYSLTGAHADHRLRLAPSKIPGFTAALALELNRQGLSLSVAPQLAGFGNHSFDQNWLKAVAADLLQHRGSSIVCAGQRQPVAVHALVFAMNEALGNNNQTIMYRDYVDSALPSFSELETLVTKLNAGQISSVILLGGNPVHDAPADLSFKSALSKAENSVHLSLYRDETSRSATWHLPMAHYLESWGDARAFDGTASVIQPMIEPLFGGHSAIELLNLLVTGEDQRGYDIVRQTWQGLTTGVFESSWRRALHDGLLADSATPAIAVNTSPSNLAAAMMGLNPGGDGLEAVFALSPQVYDGRFVNNGWLQEMPHPVSKLTWDNCATISPATAKQLGLSSNDLVQLTANGRSIEVPVWILPGQADNTIGLELGYGRQKFGRVAEGAGFDVYPLRVSAGMHLATGVALTKVGREYELVSAQDHWSMEGRPLIREASLDDYRRHPNFAKEMVEHPPLESLWKERDYSEGYQWGMAVDLNSCTGCGSCVIACQSENNIPIVGKRQVAKGREMHWLRIDRYFSGSLDDAAMVHQPVMCQHCENAPCEQVCPVAATVHDKEGLNVMVYNRCIGTRYCSNNCPYKVRRFNYFNFTKDTPEIVRMAMNPDVTVRFRGVMEKCTFCVQRISEGRIKAKLENRTIKDGEVRSACQQACPTDAIVFGNVNDPGSRVNKIKAQNRNYAMMAELNVKPRLTYLAKIRNPHPDLASGAPETDGHHG